ncbi:hypothetical protein ACIRJL_10530 [Streptomyces sp. NPDC102383]|uniref:hypothetical protein n=1 Tax=Streptomyces sp. NPDC102383 TaxID=3366165 RepID=UPI00381D7DBB
MTASPAASSSPTQDPAATPAANNSAAVDGKVPFNRRVYMVVEVLDRPEELDLLTQLCESSGWPIRPPLPDETRITPADGWTLRIVEARIQAARDGSVEQAVATFDALVLAAELSANCRDAALVERVRRPLSEWHLRGKPPRTALRIANAIQLVTRTGEHDQDLGTVRLVRVPTPRDESRPRRQARAFWAARVALSDHALAGRTRDARRHDLGQPKTRKGVQALAVVGLLLGGYLLVAAAFGKWHDLGIGTNGFGQSLVIVAVAYTAAGTVLAVRRTAMHQAAPWVLPVLISLSVPLVPWLGAQVQQRYLTSFGLSTRVSEGLGTVWAGLWVLWVSCGAVFLAIAFLGWRRYLNASTDQRVFQMAWPPALTIAALCGVALAGIVLFTAGKAGWTARGVVASGGEAGDYFGLRPAHACVKFVSADAPFYGVRPPEDRAVVTFGTNGDRIDLWVPPKNGAGVGRSVSIRLEDAQVTYVSNARARCSGRITSSRSSAARLSAGK